MKNIIILLVVLTVVLAALMISYYSGSAETDLLVIEFQNSVHEIKSMEHYPLDSFVTARNDSLYGYRVTDILKRQRINFQQIAELQFFSADGASVLCSSRELPSLYLTEIINGSTSYRLIIASDPYPQRWLKNLARIEIHAAVQ